MKIEQFSSGLRLGEDGIYFSPGSRAVSYSETGHADCYQVEDSSFWFRHRNRCIASVVANHQYSGLMLDLGGGNGYVSQGLAADGNEVLLLEPGQLGARNARLHRGLSHVVCATVEEAGFLPGSFGAIGMFDVIEHIDADRQFLESITPLLAPGGKLYLTVPCHQWLWSGADERAGHYRRHDLTSLQKLLAGLFSVDYISYFFRPLVLPQFLLRALPHRLGLGRGGVLSAKAEHGSGNGPSARLLSKLLDGEARAIAADQSLHYGASAIVAASRID
ncbi:methyltransferase domain-containing protein [Lysobacter sp. F6437]|uniref:methyltransferase domain-containing protein n=1 Tax=Lysobacter sp. F6437 TaxID=3459296 RepID=UPI00403DA8A4